MELRADLVNEWHPTNNLPLTSTSSLHIKKKYWWIGKCGHEWEASLDGRFRGSGCPICAGKIILSGFNDLATLNPVLAAEWHLIKNGEMTPKQVSGGTHRKAWWMGKCGHEWEASITNRVKGRGCPICVGKTVLVGFNDLASTHPALAVEWHPTKNQIKPTQITAGTPKKYWWLGICNHEWEVAPNNRVKGKGCPVCSGNRILTGVNDLITTHPDIAAEWHPTKNNSLGAEKVTAGMEKRVWWLAACGHEWETAICYRTRNGSRCPLCPNKILASSNDLATLNPSVASEWHPTKNGELTAKQVTGGSKMKVWWMGACGHEWEATVGSRAKGVGCPVCSGNRVLAGFNDLATLNPSLATEWHLTKNGDLLPSMVSVGMSKKVWWLGSSCKHEWESRISDRVRGSGCSVCSTKKILAGFNDLATTNPILAVEWHPTKNGKLTATEIGSTNSKAWWLGKCGHEWVSRIFDRVKGSGCPICSSRTVLSGLNDLATTHPNIATEWHPIKNGDTMPENVLAGSATKVWWLGKCGHEWEATLVARTFKKTGCNICSNYNVLTGFNDIATTHPALAAEWHPTKNGKLTPENVIAGTPTSYWWLCSKGHDWHVSPVRRSRGDGCPTCSGNRVLAGFNDLATLNPAIAAEWHPTKNGKLTPQQVNVGTHKKVWWLGAGCGHEWEAVVNNRTHSGNGCPKCANQVSKPEERIKEFLIRLGLTVEGSNWSVLKPKRSQLDLWIPEKNVAIEFNGIYWHSEKYRGKDYHQNKWLACRNKGIQLIQIWEDDWNLHPELIMRSLAHKLGVSETGQMGEAKVTSITKQQAEVFLNENHLQVFAPGSYYLALVETGDIEKLKAVMVLDPEMNSKDNSLEIIRYASTTNGTDDFSILLSYAINAYKPEFITVIADHCEANEELYANNDFLAEKELPPDYMYVLRTERKPKSDYTIQRFKDDPALKWEEGLTEMELADLNGLNRIWDAGKTRYRLIV